MTEITAGSERVRTVRFPNTVRRASNHLFTNSKSLCSAVLNEGLEILGEHDVYCDGVFENTGIR